MYKPIPVSLYNLTEDIYKYWA